MSTHSPRHPKLERVANRTPRDFHDVHLAMLGFAFRKERQHRSGALGHAERVERESVLVEDAHKGIVGVGDTKPA